jgi:hypothetical protein
MAVTAKWYGNAALGMVSTTAARRFDWVTDTIKVALLNGYSPNQDTHDFFDDVSGAEIAASGGYTAGGVSLGTKSTTYNSGTKTVRMIAGNAAWTFSASKSMTHAVIWKDTGTPSTSPVLGYIDFGGTETSSGTFTIQPDATDGWMRMVVS